MIAVDKFSRKPIYEQIIDEIEKHIVNGIIKELEKLPSIRELSIALSINPNTIQKAFAELDRGGIIFSNQGRGCFVSEGAREKIIFRRMEELGEITELASRLAAMNIPKEAVIKAIDAAYKGLK